MAVATPALEQQAPRLVFFHSTLSGHCRRVEGFLAQVLQRRRNHGTFHVVRVAEEERPDLLERFKIQTVPDARRRRRQGRRRTPGAPARLPGDRGLPRPLAQLSLAERLRLSAEW